MKDFSKLFDEFKDSQIEGKSIYGGTDSIRTQHKCHDNNGTPVVDGVDFVDGGDTTVVVTPPK